MPRTDSADNSAPSESSSGAHAREVRRDRHRATSASKGPDTSTFHRKGVAEPPCLHPTASRSRPVSTCPRRTVKVPATASRTHADTSWAGVPRARRACATKGTRMRSKAALMSKLAMPKGKAHCFAFASSVCRGATQSKGPFAAPVPGPIQQKTLLPPKVSNTYRFQRPRAFFTRQNYPRPCLEGGALFVLTQGSAGLMHAMPLPTSAWGPQLLSVSVIPPSLFKISPRRFGGSVSLTISCLPALVGSINRVGNPSPD